jgi:tetratricopeptide (TPR) repeat protein
MLLEARREILAGRVRPAARKLVALLDGGHRPDEVAYLLGTCERAMDRPEAALRTWSRVEPDSPFALRALRGRMELMIAGGHLSEGERLITDAMNDRRIDRFGLPLVLGILYSQQGRFDDALQLIASSWDQINRGGDGGSERAIQTLDMHIQVRLNPISDDEIRPFLDRAARLDPDDDRVWLAQANLGIRNGAYQEAARRLDQCLSRRPDDVPVWRAKIRCGVATNQIKEVQSAAARIPANMTTRVEVERLAGWYAGFRRDFEGERKALERLLTVAPADFQALDRLAQLAADDGLAERRREWISKKHAAEQAQAEYRAFHNRNQPVRDAVKMAKLAETLGQWFEAKAFLTLAADANPDRADVRANLKRISELVSTMTVPPQTLAEVFTSPSLGGETLNPRRAPVPTLAPASQPWAVCGFNLSDRDRNSSIFPQP